MYYINCIVLDLARTRNTWLLTRRPLKCATSGCTRCRPSSTWSTPRSTPCCRTSRRTGRFHLTTCLESKLARISSTSSDHTRVSIGKEFLGLPTYCLVLLNSVRFNFVCFNLYSVLWYFKEVFLPISSVCLDRQTDDIGKKIPKDFVEQDIV